MWQYLVVEKGFESTPVEETKKKVDSGEHVFIDVRPRGRHEDGTIPGAVSVPLYQKVDFKTFGFTKYLRAVALLVNGVEPVELNPNFMEELISAAGGKGIVIYDEIGGQLEPTSTFGSGKTSRSLLAVYEAVQSGKFKDVAHMRGGIYSWFRKGLPIDGNYDGAFAGRTPSVVEEKEFSYGRPPTLLEADEEMGGSSARK